jgi:hypothetical protein
MNLPRIEVYPPCLEIEIWLMKNKGGVIQNFTIPKNSLEKKKPIWKKYLKFKHGQYY